MYSGVTAVWVNHLQDYDAPLVANSFRMGFHYLSFVIRKV